MVEHCLAEADEEIFAPSQIDEKVSAAMSSEPRNTHSSHHSCTKLSKKPFHSCFSGLPGIDRQTDDLKT